MVKRDSVVGTRSIPRRGKARQWAMDFLECFEWGDHEYLRREWRWRFPWVAWLTIYEPRMRRGFRRLMPYRLRFAVAGVLREMLWRTCPGCDKRFTYGELIGRDGELSRYMSGTTWHKACQQDRRPDAL